MERDLKFGGVVLFLDTGVIVDMTQGCSKKEGNDIDLWKVSLNPEALVLRCATEISSTIVLRNMNKPPFAW